jgi:protein TonB
MESSSGAQEQTVETGGFPLRPVMLSLALHALLLAAYAPPVRDVSASTAVAMLHGTLLPPRTVVPAREPVATPAAPVPVARRAPRAPVPVVAAPSAASAVPPAPTFGATDVVAEPAVAAASVASSAPSPARAEPTDARGPDAAGLRQYRLALASEARRFRRYPEAARRAELAGTVEVRVAVAAGGATRAAELHRSSGHAVLDAAALEMLRRAAQRADLPQSLRGQDFAVLLPVAFEVED